MKQNGGGFSNWQMEKTGRAVSDAVVSEQMWSWHLLLNLTLFFSWSNIAHNDDVFYIEAIHNEYVYWGTVLFPKDFISLHVLFGQYWLISCYGLSVVQSTCDLYSCLIRSVSVGFFCSFHFFLYTGPEIWCNQSHLTNKYQNNMSILDFWKHWSLSYVYE